MFPILAFPERCFVECMKKGEEMNQGSKRVSVRFFDEPGWDVAMRAAPAPTCASAKRRVLTLSTDAPAAREGLLLDGVLARTIAWALIHVRTAAGRLRTT